MEWWDWLTMSPTEIKQLGFDPADRVENVGHVRALSRRWALSVGYWHMVPYDVVMRRAKVKRDAYDQFMHRWGVRPARGERSMEFILRVAEQCYYIQQYYRDQGMSRGEAYRAIANNGSLGEDDDLQIHLLPVEVMLYTKAFEDLLIAKEITAERYMEFDVKDRLLWWETLGLTGKTRLPIEVARSYDLLHVVRGKEPSSPPARRLATGHE